MEIEFEVEMKLEKRTHEHHEKCGLAYHKLTTKNNNFGVIQLFKLQFFIKKILHIKKIKKIILGGCGD